MVASRLLASLALAVALGVCSTSEAVFVTVSGQLYELSTVTGTIGAVPEALTQPWQGDAALAEEFSAKAFIEGGTFASAVNIAGTAPFFAFDTLLSIGNPTEVATTFAASGVTDTFNIPTSDSAVWAVAAVVPEPTAALFGTLIASASALVIGRRSSVSADCDDV